MTNDQVGSVLDLAIEPHPEVWKHEGLLRIVSKTETLPPKVALVCIVDDDALKIHSGMVVWYTVSGIFYVAYFHNISIITRRKVSFV